MSRILLGPAVILLMALGSGCAASGQAGASDRVLFIVPGVAGSWTGTQGLIRGLREGGCTSSIEVVDWGAPLPLFWLNFQNESIHRSAQARLAEQMAAWQKAHPGGQMDLLGHSAGGGVILGALGEAPEQLTVGRVLLLAPSVSPGYDLEPAMKHIGESLHVFYSDRDRFFLAWRTGTFGTYDNVRTKAAGNVGFTSGPQLPAQMREKLIQHPYEIAWQAWGHDGGHLGALSADFARQILAPLLVR